MATKKDTPEGEAPKPARKRSAAKRASTKEGGEKESAFRKDHAERTGRADEIPMSTSR